MFKTRRERERGNDASFCFGMCAHAVCEMGVSQGASFTDPGDKEAGHINFIYRPA